MATYDPQKGHARPKPASDEPAPVDELLDVGGDDHGTEAPTEDADPVAGAAAEREAPSVTPTPTPASPPSPRAATSPAGVSADRSGPAKKVGIGVAITAVVFALSWAFRRKRRARG